VTPIHCPAAETVFAGALRVINAGMSVTVEALAAAVSRPIDFVVVPVLAAAVWIYVGVRMR
jgi:hypothetical protein